MNHSKSLAVCLGLLLGVAAIAVNAADQPKTPAAADQQMKLPPGWTEADMQACMVAATPGKMHELMAKDVGTWTGKNTMWMAPGADPIKSECKMTIAPIMEGRYFKTDMTGQMPGMGPFTGWSINGFDNVSKEFVSSWVDNFSTGIMQGVGKLSDDGKTLTWNYTMNCPLNGKPTTLRQIEKTTSPNSKSIEAYTIDPKSGKEYKSMSMEFTRN